MCAVRFAIFLTYTLYFTLPLTQNNASSIYYIEQQLITKYFLIENLDFMSSINFKIITLNEQIQKSAQKFYALYFSRGQIKFKITNLSLWDIQICAIFQICSFIDTKIIMAFHIFS